MRSTLAPLLLLVSTTAMPAVAAPIVWINELHYDNIGGDVGEFIEVAGAADTDLTTYSIVLYNGASDNSYHTEALTGVFSDQNGGFGALSFSIPGIQNGSPDGIALVDSISGYCSF